VSEYSKQVNLPKGSHKSKSKILRSGGGFMLLATSFFSYGPFWRIEQDNKSNQFNIAVGLLETEQPTVENYGLSIGARRTVVISALQDLASQNSWCSDVYLQVDPGDIPDGISDNGVNEMSAAGRTAGTNIGEVRICADENSFVLVDDKVKVYLRTDPYIPQENNAPSIAETFSENIEICRIAKSQIMESAQSDLGRLDFLGIDSLEVLVDARIEDHPCDR
jgi:hypothetical protein